MKHNVKVEHFEGRNGPVKNQFKIFTDEGVYFQSYSTIIAFKPYSGKIQLDPHNWDYSRTTGKYRNFFLNETKSKTEKKIKNGEYDMVVLN